MNVSEYNMSVDEYSDGIYRFILKQIKDKDKAKDIVQETYIKLWNKHEDVQAEKVKSYLFTAAYHTMIDQIRKDKKNVSMETAQYYVPSTQNRYSDLKEILNEALEKLPEIQKSAILLRDYEGYDYREIGEILNLNESQVKVYIFRGRQTLKNYIVHAENLI
jgi:RNA polymerase sigma factor (sigma-70 family)